LSNIVATKSALMTLKSGINKPRLKAHSAMAGQ
jgi:hypothetical protein